MIIGIGRPRNYHVKLPSGRVYWRNRRFMKSEENYLRVDNNVEPEGNDTGHTERDDIPSSCRNEPRRSKRQRVPPTNFDSKSSKSFQTKKRGGNWCSLPLGNETSRDFSVDTAMPLSLYRDSVTCTLVCSYSPLRYILKHVQYIRCVTLSMRFNILSIATCFIYFL